MSDPTAEAIEAATKALASMPPRQAAVAALAILVVLVGGGMLASPNWKGWHTLNCDSKGNLEHTKALGTATWSVVAYCVLFSALTGALQEWLLVAFAAVGSGTRLASKFLTMRENRANPPADPQPPTAPPAPAPPAIVGE